MEQGETLRGNLLKSCSIFILQLFEERQTPGYEERGKRKREQRGGEKKAICAGRRPRSGKREEDYETEAKTCTAWAERSRSVDNQVRACVHPNSVLK